ncbi:helix-turn-helix domain-containing protein [Kitasatospora sp. NPDC087861]|uniref:helix-turn-helix domain-containing protein n=1 Tax=Kitasatospora sp. NPDC087861 TaxID=3364070 RepID=UPI00382BE35D
MTQGREEHWSTDDEDAPDWPERITKDVIRAITRRRQDLGLSAQDVADETGDLGYEVPRNVIANWESGRRKTITIPELIVVAEALDIAPVELLFSPALGGWVDYLPEMPSDRWSALTHFTGEARHSLGMYRLRLYREHERIWQELQEEHHDAFQLEFKLFREEWPPGSQDKLDAFVAAVRERLQPVRAHLREIGLEVPHLAPSLDFLDAELPPLNTDTALEDE